MLLNRGIRIRLLRWWNAIFLSCYFSFWGLCSPSAMATYGCHRFPCSCSHTWNNHPILCKRSFDHTSICPSKNLYSATNTLVTVLQFLDINASGLHNNAVRNMQSIILRFQWCYRNNVYTRFRISHYRFQMSNYHTHIHRLLFDVFIKSF